MANRRIEMYEYREIIYQLRQGQSARSVAREGLAGRKKIEAIRDVARGEGWLELGSRLPDDKLLAAFFESKQIVQQKALAQYHAEEIKKWVKEGIQASVIHRHLVESHGFRGGYDCIQRFVKKLKAKDYKQLTVPLEFQPGEVAQVDFGKGPVLFDRRVNKEVGTWFFVMTLCWSRHQYAELVTHQDIETWLKCHENAFNWFGGVIKKVVIDNAKCAITKACYYDPNVQRSYEEFAQGYGFIISACPPREPKKKGRVEAGVKFVKNNFVPLREFKDLQYANTQLKFWITGTAGNRTHGTTFEKPLSRFSDIERYQLKNLPIVAPEIAVWKKVSLYRDCHVRYLKCKYSAPYQLYGEELWLRSTVAMISIYFEHELKAMHPRLFIPGQSSTKREHLPPNAKFYLDRDPDWCLAHSKLIGNNCHFIIKDLLTDPVRDLLHQAQFIIGLEKKYGKARLENACKRAIAFNACNHKTIETILEEGLDYEQINLEDLFYKLAAVYQGQAIYQRSPNELLH